MSDEAQCPLVETNIGCCADREIYDHARMHWNNWPRFAASRETRAVSDESRIASGWVVEAEDTPSPLVATH